MSVLRLEDVVRTYRLGRTIEVPALRGISITVEAGELVAIVGPSGSGKTTLLNVAGLLDQPDSGEVWIADERASRLSEPERARARRERVGFVFQTFNLLPHLTAEENVALPLRYADAAQSRLSPVELLERVGLGARRVHKPDELSGGEQQRVAIARALMLDPPLILADEPTGDLDSETARGILGVLEDMRADGKTLIVVTHNEELAGAATRVVHMRDGHITDDVSRVAKRPAAKRAPRPATKRATSARAATTKSRRKPSA